MIFEREDLFQRSRPFRIGRGRAESSRFGSFSRPARWSTHCWRNGRETKRDPRESVRGVGGRQNGASGPREFGSRCVPSVAEALSAAQHPRRMRPSLALSLATRIFLSLVPTGGYYTLESPFHVVSFSSRAHPPELALRGTPTSGRAAALDHSRTERQSHRTESGAACLHKYVVEKVPQLLGPGDMERKTTKK